MTNNIERPKGLSRNLSHTLNCVNDFASLKNSTTMSCCA